jgi:multiple antibiotic resistance protein
MPEVVDLKVTELFIILFTTLGPIKIILPFLHLTEHLRYNDKLLVALKAEVITICIVLVIILLGPNIIEKWGLSRYAIAITGGIILFLQGINLVKANPASLEVKKMFSVDGDIKKQTTLQLAHMLIIPTIITPAGIMVILSVRSLHHGDMHLLVALILKLLAFILMCNFITMLLTPFICKVIKPIYFKILGWFFSIFIMILGVHIVVQTLLKLKLLN